MIPAPALLLVLLLSALTTLGTPSYVSPAIERQHPRTAEGLWHLRAPLVAIFSSKKDDDSKDTKKGYKFGDLSRGIARRVASSVNEVTGKEKYEFGDFTRFLDKKAKDKATELVGKDYEFGDLSRWVDSRVKDRVKQYTGKENYKFGDLTKEIGRRAISGEYKLDDFAMLCKALVSFGVGLSPVAGALPVKLLIDLLNYSLASQLGERLVGAITLEIDRRMKEAVTGNPNYQLGDLTKAGILSYIEKDEYSFGDLTKTVLTTSRMEKPDAERKNSSNGGALLVTAGNDPSIKGQDGETSDGKISWAFELTDPEILAELDEWDRALKAIEDDKEKVKGPERK